MIDQSIYHCHDHGEIPASEVALDCNFHKGCGSLVTTSTQPAEGMQLPPRVAKIQSDMSNDASWDDVDYLIAELTAALSANQEKDETIARLEQEHEERDVFSERVEKERDDALDMKEKAESALASEVSRHSATQRELASVKERLAESERLLRTTPLLTELGVLGSYAEDWNDRRIAYLTPKAEEPV